MAEEAPRPGGDPETRFEAWVREAARTFTYPPMPMRRPKRARALQARLVWVLIALLALVAVAAGVVQFIQVGALRVWLASPTPPPTLTLLPTPITSVLDLQGETTLAEAEAQAGFTLLFPTHPADLGEPQHVFYQELGAPVVVLVWLNQDGSVRLSLHLIGPGSDIAPPLEKGFEKEILTKFGYELLQITEVNQSLALWVEGERKLIARDGEVKSIRLVESPALIWETFGVTYRLEGNFSLPEMIKIAESLR